MWTLCRCTRESLQNSVQARRGLRSTMFYLQWSRACCVYSNLKAELQVIILAGFKFSDKGKYYSSHQVNCRKISKWNEKNCTLRVHCSSYAALTISHVRLPTFLDEMEFLTLFCTTIWAQIDLLNKPKTCYRGPPIGGTGQITNRCPATTPCLYKSGCGRLVSHLPTWFNLTII